MKIYPKTPAALTWLCSILEERFGQAFTLAQTANGLQLGLANDPEGKILFPNQMDVFTRASSDLTYTEWAAEAEGWQAILQQPLPMPGWSLEDLTNYGRPLISLDNNQATIQYDILGLTYWMLNRIEEIGRTDLDNHGRFPATSSHAFRHGYLERPVVDEWLHLLGQVIKRIWPQIELNQHQFSMKVSHDVDVPSLYAFKPWKIILRMMAGHLLKRHDIKAALQALWFKLTGKNIIPKHDPCNTFDWIMQISEENDLISAFYFICGGEHSHDADYQPEDPRIRRLMREIHKRGHEIGLHPSYATYQNPEAIKQQADRLRRICAEEGIHQNGFGGRMHYLRWEQPTTLQAWDDAGMAYDSTLGYADRPGFRCGTCFEYPGFNPVTQTALRLRLRPLVVMECSVIGDNYMAMGYTHETFNHFEVLKDSCQKVQGCFTLLWHNSHFMNNKDFELYKSIIKINSSAVDDHHLLPGYQ